MRRFFALVMLSLFLLNVLGYYGILQGLKSRQDVAWSQKVDNDEQLPGAAVTLKLPLTVPYGVDSRTYEPIAGEFSHEGELYRMVMQKLHKDTLYIICVKDEAGKKLDNTLTDFVKSFADTQDDSRETPSLASSLAKDFISSTITLASIGSGWERDTIAPQPVTQLIPTFCSAVIHPPERA